MAMLVEDTLKRQLKSGDLASLYLIYGDEAYLKRHYVGRIADAAVKKDFADFNLHRYEGKQLVWEELTAAVETLPMFSEHSCVIVRDLAMDSLSAQDQAALQTLLEDLPPTTVLIFWMDQIDVQPKKQAKWKKWIADFDRLGCVVTLDKRDRASLKKLLISGAKKRNCDLPAVAAEHLIDTVGDDMTHLLNELDKLCFFVGEGEIKKADIDAACVKSVEAAVFDLSKAVQQNRAEQAYRILAQLIKQRVEPVVILGTLIGVYVDMYRARLFQKSGQRPEDAAELFDYRNKSFRLRNAARDAARMSLADLRDGMDVLMQTDTLLKSSAADAKILLEQCVTQILIIANR